MKFGGKTDYARRADDRDVGVFTQIIRQKDFPDVSIPVVLLIPMFGKLNAWRLRALEQD